MIAGGSAYSLNRSLQVDPILLETSRIEPFRAPPALPKSSTVPNPTSTRFVSMPPAGVAGDHPSDTRRTGNFSGPSSSSRVSPSLQRVASVYFSVRTSLPEVRNAATAHSTALAISGEPVTRPPIPSVSRRRFSSIGDGPITCGIILAAASAQDASVAEQACPADDDDLAKGSFPIGGN